MIFNRAQFHASIMDQTYYHGIPTYKNPLDAWLYQEIIHRTRPNVIIEIGNKFGGSALYLLHQMQLNGIANARVIGVDIDHSNLRAEDKNILFIEGDASNEDVFDNVLSRVPATSHAMVIEDSAHTYDNTLKVLEMYTRLVRPGFYFVVEDTIMPPAHQAVEKFLSINKDFESDKTCERFGITYNPDGYLRRKMK